LSKNKKSKTLVTVICLVSAFIVLAGGVCFIVFYVKKRRKNGEKEKSVKESSSQK
jgi:flagellar basal body-associated protein FliL